MMKVILLNILLLSFFASAKESKNVPKEQYAQKRWNQLYQLTMQEIATVSKARNKTQKLQYRLFELKSEIVKLFKTKENRDFMTQKLKHGKKIKRKDMFKKTITLYKKANRYGLNILKKYPHSRYKAAIYYTLALNSRDFSYDNRELSYLRKSIKFSKGQTNVNYLARTSLAEYYYNKKQWKAANYQYGLVINNEDDEWYTKNLLNYGWCLLKDHKFKKAINLLEKSFKLSKDDFYIDVKEQAMTGLINFYVLGKEIERGVKFIDKNANGDLASLLKLATKASGKGFYKETQKIVNIIEDRIEPKNKKTIELYADFKLFQFDLYKQYHKSKKLLVIAKLFPKIVFNSYQREDAVRKISNIVGASQIILKKDYSKRDESYDNDTLNEIITYFNILSSINKSEYAQYEYFKAETYYSIGLFSDALKSYKTSIGVFDKTPSKVDLRRKNLDAIFSCIDNIEFKKNKKDNELQYAYNKYLSYWPSDKKARKIHPRLYSLYSVSNNYSKMQLSLDFYIKSFTNDESIQQDLYRVMLDSLIKKTKTKLLANKITKMQKGYLNFTLIEVKKSETILANILFNKFQALNKTGKSKQAIAGYQKIHFTEYYPDSIKGEAAFNMGMIYTDLQDNHNAMKWYKKSFTFYTIKEKNIKRIFLEKMALRTKLLHNFLNAAILNKFIIRNFCDQKIKNTPIFEAAIRNDLANDYITKTLFTIKDLSKCSQKLSKQLKKQIMVHLWENNHQNDLLSFINNFKLALLFPQEIQYYYESFFWKSYKNDHIKEKQMLSKIRRLKHKNGLLLQKSLDKLKKLESNITIFTGNIVKINTSKPDPSAFIKKLTSRVNKLKQISLRADKVFALGHGQVSVLVYDQLTKLANNFSKEVLAYEFPINDKDFQRQFKSEMNKISKNMIKESFSFRLKSQKLVEKYELLITAREESHLSHEILSVSDIRTPASKMAITLELGN